MTTQRKFGQHYNVRRSLSSKTIKSIVVKFKTKGSVLNQQKGAYLKNAALLKLLKLPDCQSLKTLRKIIGNVKALNMKPASLLTISVKLLTMLTICRGHWAHPPTLLEGVRGTAHLGTRESVLGRMRWLLRHSKRVREGVSNNNTEKGFKINFV